jgi:hypothetical protein
MSPAVRVRAHARYPPAQLERGASRIPRLQVLFGECVCSYLSRVSDHAAFSPACGRSGLITRRGLWPRRYMPSSFFIRTPERLLVSKRDLIRVLVLRYAFAAL